MAERAGHAPALINLGGRSNPIGKPLSSSEIGEHRERIKVVIERDFALSLGLVPFLLHVIHVDDPI
jgi:hypothetical protein